MTFSLKGLKTITNYQYEPACGILSLLDISNFESSIDSICLNPLSDALMNSKVFLVCTNVDV